MYVAGLGVPSDVQEALGWYQKAAAQGNEDAMLQLGKLYEYGLKVPKSGPQALNWYLKPAEKGNVAAELKAGYIFRDGLEDVPHDYEQALKWFRKAAQQGSPGEPARGEAECNIGRMYQEGLGVVPSVDQAAEWYTKAVQDNFPSAAILLRNLKRYPSPEENSAELAGVPGTSGCLQHDGLSKQSKRGQRVRMTSLLWLAPTPSSCPPDRECLPAGEMVSVLLLR